jgi:hypothetical protein
MNNANNIATWRHSSEGGSDEKNTLARIALELFNFGAMEESLRESARQSGGITMLVDPAFPNADTAPHQALIGYFACGMPDRPDGLYLNPDYHPTPWALHLPRPTDGMDDALQRLTTGWGSVEQLCDAMLAGTIYLEVDASGMTRRDHNPEDGVPIFTSPAHIPPPRQGRPIPFDLFLNNCAPILPLAINPETSVQITPEHAFRTKLVIDAGIFLEHRKQRRAQTRPTLPTFPSLQG